MSARDSYFIQLMDKHGGMDENNIFQILDEVSAYLKEYGNQHREIITKYNDIRFAKKAIEDVIEMYGYERKQSE